MPETSTPVLLVSEQKGIYVCEFSTSKVLDESNIKEIGDRLEAIIIGRDYPKILIDFANVEHLSSAALGMLINANNRLRQRNGELRLCNIKPTILEVFAITRLNKLFHILSTRQEALNSFTH